MRHWLVLIVAFYALLNLLIGRQILGLLLGLFRVNKFIFWPVFIILAASPLLGRFGVKALGTIGNFWMVFFYYAAFVAVLGLLIKHKPVIIGCYVVIFIAIFYGYFHAKDIQMAYYDIKIPKATQELHVVMLSDIHLNRDKGPGYIEKMVQQINALDPDLVLLAGDIFDDQDISLLEQEKNNFKNIKSQYGVYGVLGNHEYYGGHLDESLQIFKEANIKILRDSVAQVAGVNIVGREDASHKPREPLAELLKGVDKTKPIILLDHQPVDLAEAQQAGIDLQLSGHTHQGQFFPNQLITRRIFEDDYGYLAKGSLQVIVSSGYGTWGPPVRIGTQSEIVDIKIRR